MLFKHKNDRYLVCYAYTIIFATGQKNGDDPQLGYPAMAKTVFWLILREYHRRRETGREPFGCQGEQRLAKPADRRQTVVARLRVERRSARSAATMAAGPSRRGINWMKNSLVLVSGLLGPVTLRTAEIIPAK